jgi:magnesium transporter
MDGMKDSTQLDRPVTEFLSRTAATLRHTWTVDEALGHLRSGSEAVGEGQAVYFYVLDEGGKLVGVLPARQLILSAGDARIADPMMREVIAMGANETLFDALELFAIHRLLAIPVVDSAGKFLGVVEVSLYADEIMELARNRQFNEVFQLVGLHLEERRAGTAWAGFRMRMPWLLANISGGLICAALGSFFEATVKEVVILALFIPLILTLAESVAVQSMTLAIEQAVAGGAGRKSRGHIMREGKVAVLLGVCAGLIVGLVSLFWHGPWAATGVIGGAVAGAMFLAAMLGRIVPAVVHRMKLNPRVASGPVTLAVVDIVAITLYLGGARAVLGG